MPLLPILFSLLLILLSPLPTSPSPLSLPLRPHPSPSPSPPLRSLSLSSLHRAHHLKRTHPSQNAPTPLLSHSYGGYSITLDFGTPPQTLPLLLDTGSNLPWVPCTSSYLCPKCPSPAKFIPKMSSSSRLIGCLNPKCSLIHPHPKCPKCPSPKNCSSLCPPYFVIYGSGSTAGILMSETITLNGGKAHPDVAVGCSLVADRQPAGGVAGFGRGPISLPAQLNLTRFSYCVISRRFDDNPRIAGTLTLNGGKDDSADGVRFAPFVENPTVNDVFGDYYYIGLNRITVGDKKVKLPADFFSPGVDGNGGVIIDSGTTFTYMELAAFKAVETAFLEQVKHRRNVAAEQRTGLRPCFELPAGGGAVKLPELAFHFKGGAEVRLPLENYFAVVEELTAATVCLTVVTDDVGLGPSGPSMILGNFQQQNYYVVYDLERGKIGFRKEKSCVGS